MAGCGSCAGGCGGCARELTLTQGEIRMLQALAQIPFLPVARRIDDPTPVYLEDGDPAQQSLVLQLLEKKGLITLDFDLPLKNVDRERYRGYPILGSMALSVRGQSVVELIEIQGIG